MNFPPDASNWMDVFDHAFVVLGAIILAAVPSFFAARNHKSIKQMDRSINNGHTYPLRQDVDEIRDTLNSVRDNVTDIRSELRQERKDRLDLDDRFEKFKHNS